MKLSLAALSFAVLAVSAYADDRGMPYEQSQVDRGIPAQTMTHGRAAAGASGAAGTGLTSMYGQGVASVAVAGQPTATSSPWATGPWAKDHNFIAPPN